MVYCSINGIDSVKIYINAFSEGRVWGRIYHFSHREKAFYVLLHNKLVTAFVSRKSNENKLNKLFLHSVFYFVISVGGSTTCCVTPETVSSKEFSFVRSLAI